MALVSGIPGVAGGCGGHLCMGASPRLPLAPFKHTFACIGSPLLKGTKGAILTVA